MSSSPTKLTRTTYPRPFARTAQRREHLPAGPAAFELPARVRPRHAVTVSRGRCPRPCKQSRLHRVNVDRATIARCRPARSWSRRPPFRRAKRWRGMSRPATASTSSSMRTTSPSPRSPSPSCVWVSSWRRPPTVRAVSGSSSVVAAIPIVDYDLAVASVHAKLLAAVRRRGRPRARTFRTSPFARTDSAGPAVAHEARWSPSLFGRHDGEGVRRRSSGGRLGPGSRATVRRCRDCEVHVHGSQLPVHRGTIRAPAARLSHRRARSGQVLREPIEHRLVRLRCRVGVVARAGVVEEGVVDTLERAQLVGQARRGQGFLGRRQ